MVAHQQAAFIRQQPRQPRAFGGGVRHAAVQRVDGDAVKIASSVLVNRQDLRRCQTGEAGGVDRVQMKHHSHVRQALVDLPVDRPRRGINVRTRRTAFIVGIQQQQVAGANAREVFPLRIQ